MNKHVLFIHGGGEAEDYAADAKLVASLQQALGETYRVHYPFLLTESEPDMGRTKQIGREIALLTGEITLVGHSLGASMLLKYLSETPVRKKIAGVFLLSTPFWSGDEDWKQGFLLPNDFARKLPKRIPVFLYHAQDDEEVSITHLERYAQQLPQATIRKLPGGGHQLNTDLTIVVNDIRSV